MLEEVLFLLQKDDSVVRHHLVQGQSPARPLSRRRGQLRRLSLREVDVKGPPVVKTNLFSQQRACLRLPLPSCANQAPAPEPPWHSVLCW